MKTPTVTLEPLSPLDTVPAPAMVELQDLSAVELPVVQPSAATATAPVAASLQLAPQPLAGSLAPTASPWTMLGSLLLVVGLILLLSRGLRFLQGAHKGGAQAALQMRGSLHVGSRERVVWMQAGETHLLLGVSAGRVNNLHVFDVPPDFDQADHRTPSSADFAHKLRQVLDRARQRAATPAAPTPAEPAAPAPVTTSAVAAVPAPASKSSPVIARSPSQPTTRFRSAA